MMEVVVTTGATTRAKFQSQCHQPINTQLFTGPSCHPTNSVTEGNIFFITAKSDSVKR